MDNVIKSEMETIMSVIGYNGVFVKIPIKSFENDEEFITSDCIFTRLPIWKLDEFLDKLKIKLENTKHIIPFTENKIIYTIMRPQISSALEDIYDSTDLLDNNIDIIAINAEDDMAIEQNWKAINFLQQFRDKFYNDEFLPGY